MNGAASSWSEVRPLQSQLVRVAIFRLRRRAQVVHLENPARNMIKFLFILTMLTALAALAVRLYLMFGAIVASAMLL